MGATIKHIEYSFAKNKLKNIDFINRFPDYDYSRFEKKVGIKYRYKCDENENILSLAEDSCNKLFAKNNIDRESIDFLILCTQSPEHLIPSNSCILQNKLSLKKSIGTFDFNLGCSGYVYGLSIAKGLINSGQAKKVLLVTSETYSKYIHENDLINQLIFSDSSTSTIIEYSENEDINEFIFGTDGEGYDKLIVKNNFFNKSNNPKKLVYSGYNEYTDNNLYMDGPSIFNFTINKVPKLIFDTMIKNKISIDEVDYFILHQANKFLLESIRKLSKICQDKFVIDLENYGNTVSSTIPIALKNLSIQKHNNKIILCGFGVGLSWGACQINLNNKV